MPHALPISSSAVLAPNNMWVTGIAWLQARWSGVQTSLKRENFWTDADQLQGPPNLLYNLYNVSFPGVKRPGLGLEHPPPSSTEVECGYSSPLPLLKACVACNRTALLLTICCGQYRSSSSSLYSFLQPPLLSPSQTHVSSSAPYSWTHSAYAVPIMWRPKFHIHTDNITVLYVSI